MPFVGISMRLPISLEFETLPSPTDDDRSEPGSAEPLSPGTLSSWVERFLSAAAEPTSPASIDAQREALSMLFPEARVAGVSLVPPLKVGPDFPGSLGLLLVPDFLDYHETDLGCAFRNILEAPDWSNYADGLLRTTLLLGEVETACTLVIARAIDHETLLRAAKHGL
ncbi:hypothetical protein D3C72_111830 [compost metagenome]